MCTNAHGLMVTGRDLEFKNHIWEINPDITDVVEINLPRKWIHMIFPKGYMGKTKEGDNREGGGLVHQVRENLQIHKVLDDKGPLNNYKIKGIIIEKDCKTVLSST